VALPNLVVIGAMKCGTTSLHHYLDLHPEISMSRPKELNFFIGDDGGPGDWRGGTWRRGTAWYAQHFEPAAPVRGEVSPGYTSPSFPYEAGRMAAVVPAPSWSTPSGIRSRAPSPSTGTTTATARRCATSRRRSSTPVAST
jgi:hypothetical protein